jgi:hypothetical protein
MMIKILCLAAVLAGTTGVLGTPVPRTQAPNVYHDRLEIGDSDYALVKRGRAPKKQEELTRPRGVGYFPTAIRCPHYYLTCRNTQTSRHGMVGHIVKKHGGDDLGVNLPPVVTRNQFSFFAPDETAISRAAYAQLRHDCPRAFKRFCDGLLARCPPVQQAAPRQEALHHQALPPGGSQDLVSDQESSSAQQVAPQTKHQRLDRTQEHGTDDWQAGSSSQQVALPAAEQPQPQKVRCPAGVRVAAGVKPPYADLFALPPSAKNQPKLPDLNLSPPSS